MSQKRTIRAILVFGLIAFAVIVILSLLGSSMSYQSMSNIYGEIVTELGYVGGDDLSPASAVQQGQISTISNDITMSGALPASGQTQQRVILRNAWLELVVSNVEEHQTHVIQMAEEMGGWVVESNSTTWTPSSGAETTQARITVRVPAERLDEVLEQIKANADSVTSERITGEDVTSVYIDLTSRMANLETAEMQLQTLMESAETTEAVLAVYNELVDIRGEIESLRGQVQYYDQAAAFSLLNVTLRSEETAAAGDPWNPLNTFNNVVEGIGTALRFVIDALLWAGGFGIVFGVPGWFGYRLMKRWGIISTGQETRSTNVDEVESVSGKPESQKDES